MRSILITLILCLTGSIAHAADDDGTELIDLDLSAQLLVAVAKDKGVARDFKKLLAMGNRVVEITLETAPPAKFGILPSTYKVITADCDDNGHCAGGGTLTVFVESHVGAAGTRSEAYSSVLTANPAN